MPVVPADDPTPAKDLINDVAASLGLPDSTPIPLVIQIASDMDPGLFAGGDDAD